MTKLNTTVVCLVILINFDSIFVTAVHPKKLEVHIPLTISPAGHNYAIIQIGRQKNFRMMFDTGTSLWWVQSDAVLLSHKVGGTRYNRHTETRVLRETFEQTVGHRQTILTGNIVEDNFIIGEAKFQSLSFVEVVGTSESMSTDNVYDGVIGMGKSRGSAFPSLINLMLRCRKIESGVFTFRFCGTRTSETSPFRAVKGDLVFGNIRTEYSDGPMTHVQIRQSNPWTITVDAIYIDSIPLCSFCVVSIHTGEPRTTGPKRMIKTILKRLTETDRENGKIFVRCDLKGIIPTLILQLKGRYFYIPLTKLMSPIVILLINRFSAKRLLPSSVCS
ncbi:Gastricsin [Clonorchis sinensis]|uniref:Gastricsin n=1 Tax=Clonorchis sinensis TaxID=79923 RepID=A0A8T1N236_CLOSI|nr:Gastricsin [Clonorchis sinensis]